MFGVIAEDCFFFFGFFFLFYHNLISFVQSLPAKTAHLVRD